MSKKLRPRLKGKISTYAIGAKLVGRGNKRGK
jgi:hypothetical protein